jgi:mercuric ion transport protein
MSLKRFGVIGVLCCFTPVPVVLVGAVGLSWLVGYLDFFLFPALLIFISIAVYAVWREHTAIRKGEEC